MALNTFIETLLAAVEVGKPSATPPASPSTTLRLIDLIAEGPIGGLINGSKSIFLENTPLVGADDTANFNGVVWEERYGTFAQAALTEIASTEATVPVGVELKGSAPTNRRILGTGIDATRIILLFASLYEQKKSGDLTSLSVSLKVEIKRADQSEYMLYGTLVEIDKKTSPFEVSLRINFAEIRELATEDTYADSDIDIRITRTTADFSDILKNGTVSWSAYVALATPKIAYSDSAIIGLHFDGDEFGSQATNRAYEIHGLLLEVPSNYDPQTRIYDGIWDGTFKSELQWTNNPAWILYALLTNTRFGLGKTLPKEMINKWAFYDAAQHNDQPVPNGEGGTEPRYTFNGVIDTAKEAYTVLAEIASSFRCRLYFSSGTVELTQDKPADIQLLVSNANVVGGSFTYTGSAYAARHNAVAVTWINPKQSWRPVKELVSDAEGVKKSEWKQLDITGYGITSRAQARRTAIWALLSEKKQTNLVKYRAGLDHASLRVGDLIAVSDSVIQREILHGRLLQITNNQPAVLTPDWRVAFPEELGAQYQPGSGKELRIFVSLDDGLYEMRFRLQIPGSGYGLFVFIKNEDKVKFRGVASLNANFWVASQDGVGLETFKVLSIVEQDVGIYEIEALEHYPEKYDLVDSLAAKFDDLDDATFLGKSTELVVGVTGVKLTEFIYKVEDTVFAGAELSFRFVDYVDKGNGGLQRGEQSRDIAFYKISMLRPGDDYFSEVATTSSTSLVLRDIVPGNYGVRITPISYLLSDIKQVRPDNTRYFTLGGLDVPPADVTNFDITTENGITILTWDVVGDLDLSHYEIRFTQSPTGTWENSPPLVGAQRVLGTSFTTTAKVGRYLIKGVDGRANESENASFVISSIAGLANFNLAAGYVRPSGVVDATLTERAIELSGIQLPETFKRDFGVQETRLMRLDPSDAYLPPSAKNGLLLISEFGASAPGRTRLYDNVENYGKYYSIQQLPPDVSGRAEFSFLNISPSQAALFNIRFWGRSGGSVSQFVPGAVPFYPRRNPNSATLLKTQLIYRRDFGRHALIDLVEGQVGNADSWEGTNGTIVDGVLSSEPYGVLAHWTSLSFDDSIMVHRDCLSFTLDDNEVSVVKFGTTTTTTTTTIFSGPGGTTTPFTTPYGLPNTKVTPTFAYTGLDTDRNEIHSPVPDIYEGGFWGKGEFEVADTVSKSINNPLQFLYINKLALTDNGNPHSASSSSPLVAVKEKRPSTTGPWVARFPNPTRQYPTPTLPWTEAELGEHTNEALLADYGYNSNLVYQFPMIDFGASTDFNLSIDVEWETVLADEARDWAEHIPDTIGQIRKEGEAFTSTQIPHVSVPDLPNFFVSDYLQDSSVGQTDLQKLGDQRKTREDGIKLMTDASETKLEIHIVAIDTHAAQTGELDTEIRYGVNAVGRDLFLAARLKILRENGLEYTLPDGTTTYRKAWGTPQRAQEKYEPAIKLITTEGEHRATCLFPTLIWKSPSVAFSNQSTLMQVRVKKLVLRFDMKDRIESNKNLEYNPALHPDNNGWMKIKFAYAFASDPALAVDVPDLEFTSEKHIRNKTAEGFELRFQNSDGSLVSKTFDWIAKGFGLVAPARLVDQTTGAEVEYR